MLKESANLFLSFRFLIPCGEFNKKKGLSLVLKSAEGVGGLRRTSQVRCSGRLSKVGMSLMAVDALFTIRNLDF